ncbi:MAG: protoporphyrinogen oxidase [Vampirovibrionales bacterium]
MASSSVDTSLQLPHVPIVHEVDMVVIGSGVSGLSTAWHYLQASPVPQTVKVLSAKEAQGGWVQSASQTEGFLLEKGPHTLLGHHPILQSLLPALKLKPIMASKASKKRFIVLEETLCPAPSVALNAMGGLLGWGAWVWKQLWMPPHPEVAQETQHWSVAEWGRQRFSQRFVDTLLTPLCSGIYAGNPEQLGFQDTFKALHTLECEGQGSLLKGWLKKQYQSCNPSKQTPCETPHTKKKVPYHIISFPKGLGELSEALATSIDTQSPAWLQSTPKANATLVAWDDTQQQWHITDATGTQWQTPQLVMACQLQSWETLLAPLLESTQVWGAYREVVDHTPYSSLAMVQLGIAKEACRHPLQGFGALVSHRTTGTPQAKTHAQSRSPVRLLGSLWPSSMFPNRSPEDHHLLINFYGGAIDPDSLTWEDDALITDCLHALHHLGILKSPTPDKSFLKLVQVQRAIDAIPQSTLGHRDRVSTLKTALNEAFKGRLHVVGSWSHGISVTDCLAAGKQLAQTLTP